MPFNYHQSLAFICIYIYLIPWFFLMGYSHLCKQTLVIKKMSSHLWKGHLWYRSNGLCDLKLWKLNDLEGHGNSGFITKFSREISLEENIPALNLAWSASPNLPSFSAFFHGQSLVVHKKMSSLAGYYVIYFPFVAKKHIRISFYPSSRLGMTAPLSVGSRRVVGLLDLGLVGHDGKPWKAMEQPAVLVGKTSMPAHSLWPLWFFPIKGTLKWPSQRPFFWVYVTYTWLLKDVTENVLVAGHFNSEITAG